VQGAERVTDVLKYVVEHVLFLPKGIHRTATHAGRGNIRRRMPLELILRKRAKVTR
jgi:hypothetical protein